VNEGTAFTFSTVIEYFCLRTVIEIIVSA